MNQAGELAADLLPGSAHVRPGGARVIVTGHCMRFGRPHVCFVPVNRKTGERYGCPRCLPLRLFRSRHSPAEEATAPA